MLTFLEQYSDHGKYSQNGEFGILQECLKRIKPKIKTACEFGAPSFYYCSNVAQLEEEGWKIKMFDIDEQVDARIKRAKISPNNVNEVVGHNVSVLSIDIDNDDYHVWKAYRGKPAIVIIEINSGIEPVLDMIPGDSGSSYKSMTELGISKGYFLLCHTGNLIFIDNQYSDLFDEIDHDPIGNHHLFFNRSFL